MLVVGSINTDLVVRGSRLPGPGETIIGGSFAQFHGGKGANQAVATARLAQRQVTFVGCVGDDGFGQQALAHLKDESLNCQHIKVAAGVPSGVALILVDSDGENAISVASGANLQLTPDDIAQLPNSVFDESPLLLASLEVPIESVMAAVARARKQGATTIVNPAPANLELLTFDLGLVDILTPNEVELSQLADVPVTNVDSAILAARKLIEKGCHQVVVTLGPQGALIVTKTDDQLVAVEPVQAVDTTAAGDAFNGALAVQLTEGTDIAIAVARANQAASLSVTRAGAQSSLARRNELDW